MKHIWFSDISINIIIIIVTAVIVSVSWYNRTLRRAKSMLKQVPTVFQVKGAGEIDFLLEIH